MKTRSVVKLGILAVVVLGFLSGCIIIQNSATIDFINNAGESLDCYFAGSFVGTVPDLSSLSFNYTWSGSTIISVYWEARFFSDNTYRSSGYVAVQDGLVTSIYP